VTRREESRTAQRAATLLAAVLALGGCAGQPGDARDDGPVTDHVRIGLTEWTVETGGVRASAGEVTLVVTNTGATGHDVVVHGSEGTWGTPVLEPGESHEVVVETVPGEVLDLVCTVTGHRAAGMSTTLAVAAEDEP
jgi:plastocyanin